MTLTKRKSYCAMGKNKYDEYSFHCFRLLCLERDLPYLPIALSRLLMALCTLL